MINLPFLCYNDNRELKRIQLLSKDIDQITKEYL